jgi:hypothetical protein
MVSPHSAHSLPPSLPPAHPPALIPEDLAWGVREERGDHSGADDEEDVEAEHGQWSWVIRSQSVEKALREPIAPYARKEWSVTVRNGGQSVEREKGRGKMQGTSGEEEEKEEEEEEEEEEEKEEKQQQQEGEEELIMHRCT